MDNIYKYSNIADITKKLIEGNDSERDSILANIKSQESICEITQSVLKELYRRCCEKDLFYEYHGYELIEKIENNIIQCGLCDDILNILGTVGIISSHNIFLIDLLGKLKNNKAVRFLLLRYIHHECDWEFKEHAILALGEIGDERAMQPIISILKPIIHGSTREYFSKSKSLRGVYFPAIDYTQNIRCASIIALGNIKSELAADVLIKCLFCQDVESRKEAANALGKINAKKAIASLIEAQDDVEEVRIAAVKALELINKS